MNLPDMNLIQEMVNIDLSHTRKWSDFDKNFPSFSFFVKLFFSKHGPFEKRYLQCLVYA